MTLEILAKFVMLGGVLFLYVLFYFQQQRQDKMTQQIATMIQWIETLRDNQEVLAKDIRKVNHEVQNSK